MGNITVTAHLCTKIGVGGSLSSMGKPKFFEKFDLNALNRQDGVTWKYKSVIVPRYLSMERECIMYNMILSLKITAIFCNDTGMMKNNNLRLLHKRYRCYGAANWGDKQTYNCYTTTFFSSIYAQLVSSSTEMGWHH